MQDFESFACPTPEAFSDKIGTTVFIALLFFQGFLTRIMFAPLMPAIEKDVGISHAQAGSLFLMISLGYLLAPLCSGLVSSKINHRGTLKLSAWLIGLGLLPFAFVRSFWVICVLLIVIGLSAGIHLPSAIATITAEVRREDWGKALGVHQSAPRLSFVIAPLIAATLLSFVSWRAVLVFGGCAGILLAAAYSLMGKYGDFPGQPPNPKNIKLILSTPSFYLMILLFAMAIGDTVGIYAMIPLFLTTQHGFSLSWANTLLGLSQVAGLLMVFVAGWIIDRIGQKPAMAIILLTAGIATVLIGLLKGAALIAVIFIQPILVSGFFPGAFAALSRITPPHMRSVTSALVPPIAFLIGGGILPTAIGYMGQTYTFGAGMMLAGAFMLPGPLLVLLLKLGQYDDQAGC